MVFKVDFEKAYDTLNWNFLLTVLKTFGFPDKQRQWIRGRLNSGRASVIVNGSPTSEFPIKHGLRQGDPMAPFLFIIALEALGALLSRAVAAGSSINHLCFADDVLFLGEWSVENVKNLSRFLRWFYLISGLKVNIDKYKLFGVGVEDNEVISMANTLHCDIGRMPFWYLGLPIGANMKRVNNWQPIIEIFSKKLSAWKARHLSFAGRLTLAKFVLGSVPSYFFSLFKGPKAVLKTLEGIRRAFIWGNHGSGKKVRWVPWEKVTKPKDMGGLGIGGLKEINVAMGIKWWWRYIDNNSQLWAQVIKSIHSSSRSNNLIPLKKTVTGLWKDIGDMENELYSIGIQIKQRIKGVVGDGKSIRFWDAYALAIKKNIDVTGHRLAVTLSLASCRVFSIFIIDLCCSKK
ncbi:putative RNA-directed DNA polymerase [Helianthus annuus]|nr:putative RNA-directed DNA polymerase [Helianthus annuus]